MGGYGWVGMGGWVWVGMGGWVWVGGWVGMSRVEERSHCPPLETTAPKGKYRYTSTT